MKKQTLTFIAMMAIGSLAYSQVADKPKSRSTVKTEINSTEQLNFQSIEEKNAAIEKIQKLIDYRISKGKTQEEMTIYYAELKKTKNALIIPKKNTNEK